MTVIFMDSFRSFYSCDNSFSLISSFFSLLQDFSFQWFIFGALCFPLFLGNFYDPFSSLKLHNFQGINVFPKLFWILGIHLTEGDWLSFYWLSVLHWLISSGSTVLCFFNLCICWLVTEVIILLCFNTESLQKPTIFYHWLFFLLFSPFFKVLSSFRYV